VVVVGPDTAGVMYFLSTESGAIWERDNGGAYTLENTNTEGDNIGGALLNNTLYYWTSTKLGQKSGAVWDDNFANFTNTCTYRPCTQFADALWIGNFNDIAKVDKDDAFTASALDIAPGHRAAVLDHTDTELIIGTIRNSSSQRLNKIMTWDSYSDSWLQEDDIYEKGIGTFIRADNFLFFTAIGSENLYFWNGRQAQKTLTLRGESPERRSYAFNNNNGKAYFAVGTKIFSIHRQDQSMQFAVIHEHTADAAVTSLGNLGGTLYIGTDNGAETLDTSVYDTATLDTPVAMGNFQNVIVDYTAMPTGTSIGISTKVDGGTWTAQTTITDTINKKVYFDGGLGDVNNLQARITLNPSGASTPVITNITFV
jgi:hypothetical protein